MGVLVALLSVLLVAATAEGGHAAPATTAAAGEKSTVLGFRSASEVSAYWRAVLPNTPMPPAILERISGPPGDKGDDKKMENKHTWYPRTEEEAKKLVHGPSLSSEKILFPEDVFITPGSEIDLYIDSSATLRTACKSHEIADHVPMSMKDLNDILAKYAPTSLAMARDIWSTINVCEHARPVKGEQQTCTASVKTMVEFAVSVLGTSDLLAFSSPDVPAEGITSPAQRYKVAVARPVTTPAGAKASTMTCHSMEFPYPAYYCHAVNPTRVYEVTLQREKGGAAAQGTTPAMLRALAVCHLDSSGFDARMSFFMERGIKPGDAPACHFLSKGSVLWAPASWTGPSELVAAQ